MSVIAVLCVNMVTANMLLSVFFVSGALAGCPNDAKFFITAPKKMEALSGSCLQIPCDFSLKPEQQFDSKGQTFGVWIKSDSRFGINPNNVIFNSSKTVNTYPMSITGNLSEKNCATLFSSLITSYTNTYFFRIENKLMKATAVCDPVQITVKDSAPSPRIEISAGDLKENQSVSITCSAVTPCPHSPPELTWILQQNAHNKIEENTDRTLTAKIQETITLSEQHDGYNISCSVRYPVNEGKEVKTAEERKTLSVSYAPKNTSVSISPSGLVSAGSWVNLTCSSRAKPPVSRFTWFKNSKDGPMNVAGGQFYSFNVTDGGVYYCVATNDLGEQTSSEIQLTIKDAPKNTSVSISPSLEVHPAIKGTSLQWALALGGIVVILLICAVIYVWRFKSAHQTPQQTDILSGDELVSQMSVRKTEEENIHYGEIDFSQQRPEPSVASVQHSSEQQDMLYAQVNVSRPANSLTQTADGLEDLYAQVKKK